MSYLTAAARLLPPPLPPLHFIFNPDSGGVTIGKDGTGRGGYVQEDQERQWLMLRPFFAAGETKIMIVVAGNTSAVTVHPEIVPLG